MARLCEARTHVASVLVTDFTFRQAGEGAFQGERTVGERHDLRIVLHGMGGRRMLDFSLRTPSMSFSVVVFPAPFEPRRPKILPRSTGRFTPSTTVRAP